MTLLDGKILSTAIQQDIKDEVQSMVDAGHPSPHLTTVIVGNNPASRSYVTSKMKACSRVGFTSELIEQPGNITQDDLLQIVEDLNKDPKVDGFIVQLPLPPHIDEEVVGLAIDYKKDVDGFHPMNFGRMALGLPSYLPATPFGILEMLKRYKVETSGKHCVVLGRSNIVGTPISILLSRKAIPGNCTVTLAHSRTKNIKEEIKRADIIIAALGIPHFVKEDMVKKGVTIIDVGINRIEDKTRKRGYRLVGDVDFENVAPKCSYITPVPGGVGLMTVTALMMNTLLAANNSIYPK